MKTPNDPRHQKRIERMEGLFSYSFHDKTENEHLLPIIPHLKEIDACIVKVAPEWPLDKIAKVDLAILRLAVYEMTMEKETPPKVVIDEAVELAKAYGNDGSAKFINGALGALIKDPN